jgi:thiol-disulfide isomerase/thioredoxin
MATSGFQELLGGAAVDDVLACSPEALTPVSLSKRLQGKKFAVLYFSANWCGPCKRFTPLLSDWYSQVKDNVEVVFASCCDDADAFDTYAKKHPWLALPYEVSQGGIGYVRSAVREETGQEQGKMAVMCDVRSVPTIGVFDVASGDLISLNGRHDISSQDNGPDGEKPHASYSSPATVLQKWVAQRHSWVRPAAAAVAHMVVEPVLMPRLLAEDEAATKSAAASKLFVLLVAAADPETGQSWCPDCVSVRARLEALFEKLPAGVTVVEAPVTREEWRGNAGHPYRAAPFGAQGVPCLLRIGPGGTIEASLTEGELQSENLEVFTGLEEDPALTVPTGETEVLVTGLPNNPARTLAYQIKTQLELTQTPYVRAVGANGRALLTVLYAPDLAKVKAATEPFEIFGAKVAVASL